MGEGRDDSLKIGAEEGFLTRRWRGFDLGSVQGEEEGWCCGGAPAMLRCSGCVEEEERSGGGDFVEGFEREGVGVEICGV